MWLDRDIPSLSNQTVDRDGLFGLFVFPVLFFCCPACAFSILQLTLLFYDCSTNLFLIAVWSVLSKTRPIRVNKRIFHFSRVACLYEITHWWCSITGVIVCLLSVCQCASLTYMHLMVWWWWWWWWWLSLFTFISPEVIRMIPTLYVITRETCSNTSKKGSCTIQQYLWSKIFSLLMSYCSILYKNTNCSWRAWRRQNNKCLFWINNIYF